MLPQLPEYLTAMTVPDAMALIVDPLGPAKSRPLWPLPQRELVTP